MSQYKYSKNMDPKKMRKNPLTNQPWKKWDPRPNIDQKDGYSLVAGKKYPVDDDHVFDSFFTQRKNRRGEYIETDKYGYYFERWTLPKTRICKYDGCNNEFKFLRERKLFCDDHAQKFRGKTYEEMKKDGFASCNRSDFIGNRTGCTGIDIPLEMFMTVDGRFWKGKTEGSEMIPPLCRDCKNEKSWIYKLKKEHNMTPEEYDKQLKKQDFVCAVCKLPDRKQKLSVDHDHEFDGTNIRLNRGLICEPCNLSLRDRKKDHNESDLHLRMAIYLKMAEVTKRNGFQSGDFSVNYKDKKKALNEMIVSLGRELDKDLPSQ